MFTQRRTVNVSPVERQISMAVGGVVALYALRRSLGHLLLLGLGSYFVYRGVTGHCVAYQALGISTSGTDEGNSSTRPAPAQARIETSVTVNRRPEEVYGFWHKLDNLPRFMDHLESVQTTGTRRSHWVAAAPLKAEWDAEIIDERPNELICWRSLPGSQVDNAGTVSFKAAPDGFGTEVHVSMQFNPPGGPFGAAAARVLKPITAQQVREDLRRFKEMMEAGEAASVKGQASGRAGTAGEEDGERGASAHPKDVVQKASEDSFPASDPPGWAMSTPGRE